MLFKRLILVFTFIFAPNYVLAVDVIPAGWANSQSPLTMCGIAVGGMGRLFSSINRDSSEHLARAAYFHRNQEKDPVNALHRRHVYRVSRVGSGLALVLHNATHELDFIIEGTGPNAILKVQATFFGQKMETNFRLEDTNLKFITSEKKTDPTENDLRVLNGISETALESLAPQRSQILARKLEELNLGAVQTDSSETPVVMVRYNEGQLGYFRPEATDLKVIILDKGSYYSTSYGYQALELVMGGFYLADPIGGPFLGKMQSNPFNVDRILEHANYTYESSLPNWVRR